MKKLGICLGALALLTACGIKMQPETSPFYQPFNEVVPIAIQPTEQPESTVPVQYPDKTVRMAFLLPLSGTSASVGDSFQKSVLLAQADLDSDLVQSFFFDTKGTVDGAKEAYKAALHQSPDVIIGPVFAPEVKAISDLSPSVPVISFTSDNTVVDKRVWTMALLIPEQVDAMAMYACQEGKRKLAVLGPENKVGELTLNTLQKSVEKCPGMVVEKISLYNPKASNLDPAILKVVPKPIDPKKKELTEAEQAELQKPIADRVPYDALFIVDDGVRLKQVASLLSFYDVNPREVMMMGLSAVQAAGKDKSVRGMYFPSMPIGEQTHFEQKFKKTFNTKPLAVSSFAYDAVMLSAYLNAQGFLDKNGLTARSGFKGLNGLVRFNRDGTNNRVLDIYQINPYGRPKLVQSAQTSFENIPQKWFWNDHDEQNIVDVSADLEKHKQRVIEQLNTTQPSDVTVPVDTTNAETVQTPISDIPNMQPIPEEIPANQPEEVSGY